jgi:hypothetical protein
MGPTDGLRIFSHPPLTRCGSPKLNPLNPTPKFSVKMGKDTHSCVSDDCHGKSRITFVRLQHVRLDEAFFELPPISDYNTPRIGVRRGDVLSLSWDDVKFDTFDVRVQAPTSKSRKERVIPMARELAELLKTWRTQTDQAASRDPVLPWPYDTYRQLYTDWHRIQSASEIPDGARYVPKNCRSTCASELIANGVPTVVVKDFLGHATVATTENYYINTKPALRAEANARKVRLEDDHPSSDDSDPEAVKEYRSDGKM